MSISIIDLVPLIITLFIGGICLLVKLQDNAITRENKEAKEEKWRKTEEYWKNWNNMG